MGQGMRGRYNEKWLNQKWDRRLIEGYIMATTTYRGIVRGGVIQLENAIPLTEGTEVFVTPLSNPHTNGAAVVAALEKAPQVPAEWVDELDRLIEEGNRPASPPEGFLDDSDR